MTNNFSTFKNGNTHLLFKQYYTPDFINNIYEIIRPMYESEITDKTKMYKQLNHNTKGNYNYTLNSKNTPDFNHLQTILNDFNTLIRNELIINNNSFVNRNFSINLTEVNLCITRQNTLPTNIVKTQYINIFIPLHNFPNGTVTIFKDADDIIQKYYNIDHDNKIINYGNPSNYEQDDINELLNKELYIDTFVGDVLIINNGVFSRSIPNMIDYDRYCLQLLYDIKI
uniref:Uncharacterized protein n=1 Tax=viral metagenome TaxID=1070528 RepID=A0A6C0BTM8_9ZZZZ